MNERFDYKQSLTNIKASLFDIYEDQEKVIGSLDDDIKPKHLQDFIEVKDLALFLLNRIQDLYYIPEEDSSDDDTSVDIETQESFDLEDDNIDISSEEISDNNLENIDEVSFEEDSDKQEFTGEESTNEIDSDDDSSLEKENSFNFVEDNSELEQENNKYYLTCEEKDLHFAYVSQKLFDKLKSHSSLDGISNETDVDNENGEEEIEEYLLYKKDELKPKGIIVRNDQYMKLALSKHRQEGVLEEAKIYRREVIKKKRREEQKQALDEAKVEINI